MQRPIHLVLDFDGTLTKKDTGQVISTIGYRRQKLEGRFPAPWEDIVDAYVADLAAHTSSYATEKQMRATLDDEAAWLNSLKPTERTSAQRIHDSGLFHGVTGQDVDDVAAEAFEQGRTELRSGWLRLLSRVTICNQGAFPQAHEKVLIDVVSVGWSRRFIWSLLSAAASADPGDMPTKEQAAKAMAQVAIYANELPSIEPVGATTSDFGQPEGRAMELRTSGDKLAQMNQVLDGLQDIEPKPMTIYIGDSPTDLECLMAADIGICVRDEPLSGSQNDLLSTCLRLGIEVSHISEFGNPFNEPPEKQLWWAADFVEVETWLAMFFLMTPVEARRAQEC